MGSEVTAGVTQYLAGPAPARLAAVTVQRARAGERAHADRRAVSTRPQVLARLGVPARRADLGRGGRATWPATGANQLAEHRVHAGAVLGRQLRNPLLILLLSAAVISAFTGGATNSIIITVIVALSVGLGFFNEYSAEVAMSALRERISHLTTVRRDGQLVDVEVAGPGPGRRGRRCASAPWCPADLRLLEVDELECDEGVLTGESLPVEKVTTATVDPGETSNLRPHGHRRAPGLGRGRGRGHRDDERPSARSRPD